MLYLGSSPFNPESSYRCTFLFPGPLLHATGIIHRVIFFVPLQLISLPALSLSPEEWVRPVMKRDKQVLLHWGYYPDRWGRASSAGVSTRARVRSPRTFSKASYFGGYFCFQFNFLFYYLLGLFLGLLICSSSYYANPLSWGGLGLLDKVWNGYPSIIFFIPV